MSNSDFPWFPFYVRDWLTDAKVASMNATARGCFVQLLCYQWENGSLPSATLGLASLSGANEEEWSSFESYVDELFPEDDGVRRNPRMERERQNKIQARELQRRGGRKGGSRKPKGKLKGASSLPEGRASDDSHPHPDFKEPLTPRRGEQFASQSGGEIEDLSADLATRFGTRDNGTNPRAEGTNSRAEGTNSRAAGENPRGQGDNPRAKRYRAVQFLQTHEGMILPSGTQILRVGVDNGRCDQPYADMELKDLEAFVKNVKAVLADRRLLEKDESTGEPLTVTKDGKDGQTDVSTGSV